jgi:hypothetical protein
MEFGLAKGWRVCRCLRPQAPASTSTPKRQRNEHNDQNYHNPNSTGPLLHLYDAFIYGMEKGLKEGLTARKGRGR